MLSPSSLLYLRPRALQAGRAAARAAGAPHLIEDAQAVAWASMAMLDEGVDDRVAYRTAFCDAKDWVRQYTRYQHEAHRARPVFAISPHLARTLSVKPIDFTRNVDLGRLLTALRPREREYIVRSYWNGEKNVEIARAWGITDGRVSQIERATMRKLRDAAAATNAAQTAQAA